MTTTHIETPETPAEAESLVGVANDDLFVSWISERFPTPESAKLQCAEATASMSSAFPQLQRVRGHAMVGIDFRPHWWCITTEGEIIDPTEHQWDRPPVFYEALTNDEEPCATSEFDEEWKHHWENNPNPHGPQTPINERIMTDHLIDHHGGTRVRIGDEVENADARFFVGAINESQRLCTLDKSKPWTLKNEGSPMAACIRQGNYASSMDVLQNLSNAKNL